MKEWGLVRNYGDYFDLPEPVVLAWRECARAESAAAAPTSKPTQDLLAQERDQSRLDDLSAARTASLMIV